MTDDEHELYLHSALQSEDLELIATAYWQYGDHHHALQRRYDVAQHFYERALQLVPKTEYHSLAGIILSYMGQLAEVRGDFEVATYRYRESYERMKTDGVRSATRPRNLAGMLLLKGNEVQARELFRIALDNAIYLGSPLWTCEILLVIADYLKTKVDFVSSVQLLAACFRLLTQLQEPATGWKRTPLISVRRSERRVSMNNGRMARH